MARKGNFFVYVQGCSLGTLRSITRSLWFPIRPDYIFTPVGCSPLRDRLISTPLRDSRWGLLNILVGLARNNLTHSSNTGSEPFSQCCSTELFGPGDKYSTNIPNFLWSEFRFVLEIRQCLLFSGFALVLEGVPLGLFMQACFPSVMIVFLNGTPFQY